MLSLFVPLLLGLATTSTNAASLPKPSLGPSLRMNLTDLYASTTNMSASSLGSDIDPGFDMEYQLGDVLLRPIACLINAVNAMTNLALHDFDGDVQAFIASMPAFPDVMIRNDATARLRFIFWGVWNFALYMMDYNIFQTMFLTLRFNKAVVGYLTVERWDPLVLNLAGSDGNGSVQTSEKRAEDISPAMPVTNNLANYIKSFNSTGLGLINTTNTLSVYGLHVFIRPFGQVIAFREFFVPILAALDHVARFPSTSPATGFLLHFTDIETLVEFRDFGGRPRMQAPFFKWQHIAMALRELAWQMALSGALTEAVIVIQFDGINVGDGWLRRR